MTGILHKPINALARHGSEYDRDSIKQRQNSEKARQNGTHPDVQQDKNKSATAYKHTYGNDLGDTSRSYPEDGMTSGTIGARNGEASQGVEQRRTQDN